jgi:hypothetical protein
MDIVNMLKVFFIMVLITSCDNESKKEDFHKLEINEGKIIAKTSLSRGSSFTIYYNDSAKVIFNKDIWVFGYREYYDKIDTGMFISKNKNSFWLYFEKKKHNEKISFDSIELKYW